MFVCLFTSLVLIVRKWTNFSNIDDPKGKPIEEVRKIRAQIENQVIDLLETK